jgi:gluconokinase
MADLPTLETGHAGRIDGHYNWTSGAARMVTGEVFTDAQMRTFCYHLKDELYIIGGASSNGAIVLQWLKENILQTDDSLEMFFSLAAGVPPCCNQLIFLPYILG